MASGKAAFAPQGTFAAEGGANVPAETIACRGPAKVGMRRPEFARIRLAFGTSAYFHALPAATLDRLAESALIERCDGGGAVHEAGARVDKLWLVIEGGLLVS